MKTVQKILKGLRSYIARRSEQRHARKWMRGELGASRLAPQPSRVVRER
jgi:hypothetical protein